MQQDNVVSITSTADTGGLDAFDDAAKRNADALDAMASSATSASSTTSAALSGIEQSTQGVIASSDAMASSSTDVVSSLGLQQQAYDDMLSEISTVGPAVDQMASDAGAAVDTMGTQVAGAASDVTSNVGEVTTSLAEMASESVSSAAEFTSGMDEVASAAASTATDAADAIGQITDAMQQEAAAAADAGAETASSMSEAGTSVDSAADSMGNGFERIQGFIATVLEAKGGLGALMGGVVGGAGIAAVSEDATAAAAGTIAASGGVLGLAKNMGLLTPEAVAAGAAIAGVGVVAVELGKDALDTASNMEQFATKFTILEGSSAKASATMAHLEELSQTLPFPVESIMTAVSTLERLNAQALETADGMKLISDNAVMTNTSLQGSASLFGRLYAAMEGGVPITRFLMQMFRTGAITADTRTQIIALAADVKNGALTMEQAWPRVTDSITRFSGAAAAEADTFEGRMVLLGNAMHVIFDRVGQVILPVAEIVVSAVTLVAQAFGKVVEVADEVGRAVLAPFAGIAAAINDDLVKPIGAAVPVVDVLAVVLGVLTARLAVSTAQFVIHGVSVLAAGAAHAWTTAMKLGHVAADKALDIAEGETTAKEVADTAATVADAAAHTAAAGAAEAEAAAKKTLFIANSSGAVTGAVNVGTGAAAAEAGAGAAMYGPTLEEMGAAAAPAAESTGLLAGAMAALSGAAGTVVTALTATAVTIGALAVPVWAVIAAVAALGAAWMTNFLGIRDVVGGAVNFVIGVFHAAIDVMTELGRIAYNIVGRAFEYVGDLAGLAGKAIGTFIDAAANFGPVKTLSDWVGTLGNVLGGIADFGGKALGTIGGVVGGIADFLDSGAGKAAAAAQTAADAEKKALDDAAAATKAQAATNAGYVADALIEALPDDEQAALDTASKMVTGIKAGQKTVDDAWDALTTDLADPKHFDPAVRAADLYGKLTGKTLADALASTDPVIHAEAVAAKAQIENELKQLGGDPGLDTDASDSVSRRAAAQFNLQTSLQTKYGAEFNAAQEQAGRDANDALVKGYKDTQSAVDSAIDTLNKDLADPAHFDAATRAAYLVGELQTIKIKEGLAAGNPALQAELENTQSLVEGELESLTGTTDAASAQAAAWAKWPDQIGQAGAQAAAEATAATQKVKDAYDSATAQMESDANGAFAKITDAVKNQQTPSQEAGNLWGVLTSKAVQDGLHSQDENTRIAVQGQVDVVQKELSHLLDTIDPLTASLAAQMANGLDHAALPVDASAERLARLLPDALNAGSPEVEAAAQAQIAAYADGIRSSRKTIDDAITQLNTDAKNALTPSEETARLIGTLTSKALAEGLKSSDPLVVADAENVQSLLVARLEAMKFKVSDIGGATAKELAAALAGGAAGVRKAAEDSIVRAILEPLGPLGAEASAKTDEAGKLLEAALKKHHGDIAAAAADVTKTLKAEQDKQKADAAAAYQAKLKQWDSDVALARKMGEEPPAKPIPVGVAITAPPKSDATAAADKVVNDFVTQTTSPASVESATTAFQTLINDGVAGITTTDQLASYTSAGEKAAQTVLDGLNEKVATFTTYGEAIGEAWVKGVVDAITNGKLTISTAAQGATKGLAGSSPPTEGPLHEIDVWGANVGSAWVGPFVAKIAGAKDLVSSRLAELGKAMVLPERAQTGGVALPQDRVPIYGATGLGRNAASPDTAAGLTGARQTALLEKTVSAMEVQNRLIAQLVAQEPTAATPMTARGELARTEFLMPGGRL